MVDVCSNPDHLNMTRCPVSETLMTTPVRFGGDDLSRSRPSTLNFTTSVGLNDGTSHLQRRMESFAASIGYSILETC